MGQYYYAVTSLPQLFFDSDYYPSTVEFLDMCRQHLSPRDLRALEIVASGEEIGGRAAKLLEEWTGWNASLLNDLALLRAQHLGRNLEDMSAGEVIGTEELAREIYSQDSPLAAEEALERLRWKLLDDLEVGHYFDIQKVIVYYLRLLILERIAQFSAERGLENFTTAYETVADSKIGHHPEKEI